MNGYYTVTGTPATLSGGASAPMRTEFVNIQSAFNLLPTLSGNANCAVVVNGSGTALTTTTGQLALAGNFTTTGAFNTTLAQQASVTLTLPAVTGTLATLAGTETLTNKTITSATLAGTTTLSGAVTATGQTVTGGTFSDITLSGTVTLPGSGAISSAAMSFSGYYESTGNNSASDGTNGHAYYYSSTAGGANINGKGTSYDVSLNNNAGTLALGILTGTTSLVAASNLYLGFTADQGGGQPLQVNGGVFVGGRLSRSATANVTAFPGGGQTSATQLTTDIN